MKRVYNIVLMALAAAALGSCNDFLDTSSPSTFTPETVYDNPSMTEKVLMGVYAKMTEDATYSQDLCFTMCCGTDIEIRSYTKDKPNEVNRAAAHYLADATNSYLSRSSTALYDAIERANLLIEGIEDVNPDNDEVWMMHAEAVAIRAQCYRDLIRMFGNVPFKIEPTKTDLSNVYLPKTDRFEIMEKLIGQLLDCADKLPWKQATPERVTQGYARGLAAQLALMRAGWNFSTDCVWEQPRADANAYYEIARAQCKLVMDSGQYSLTGASTANGKAISGFEAFFRGMCERRYLDNESLYEVGFVVARSSELGYTIGPRVQTATPYFGYSTQGQIFTTPEYFYSFHPADSRRDVSVYYTEYRDISDAGQFTNHVKGDYGLSMNIISNAQQFRVGKWDPTWMQSDWAAASFAAGGKVGTGVNVCMMRYSEVLLMFAEAEFNLNGATGDAKDALWEVRSRAIPTMTRSEFDTYVDGKKGGFMQAVKDERRWEFLGENVRKWDLIRWGELPQAIIDMRRLNKDLVLDMRYEFEFPTTVVNGVEYQRELPTEVYYKYDSSNLYIEDINLDYMRSSRPVGDEWFSANDGGVWIYEGTYLKADDGKSARWAYPFHVDQHASGLVDANGQLVENGRPFFPIPSEMITSYNGVLKQDYHF